MRGASHEMPQNLFVAAPDGITEVRELMQSRHIEDHRLAIDALRNMCFAQEELTTPPPGKNFRDRHHFYRKPNMKGYPYSRYRQSPDNKALLRRDCHENLERIYGWLARPLLSEVMEWKEAQEVEERRL